MNQARMYRLELCLLENYLTLAPSNTLALLKQEAPIYKVLHRKDFDDHPDIMNKKIKFRTAEDKIVHIHAAGQLVSIVLPLLPWNRHSSLHHAREQRHAEVLTWFPKVFESYRDTYSLC